MLRGCRWIGVLLASVLATPVLAQTGPDPAAPLDQAIAAAEASLQSGDVAAAERHYNRALFLGWLLTATLERAEGRIGEAGDALRGASTAAGDDREALLTLAGAQLDGGQAAPAVEVLTVLAAKEPLDPQLKRQLAKALAVSGQLEAAAQKLEEAHATAPDDAELAFLVATDYLWMKKPEAAERLFAQIRAQRPIAQTHVLIGRAYRDADEHDRARTELGAALKLDPIVRRAHYYLGMVALGDTRTGPTRIENAIAEFAAELTITPQDPLISNQLGMALLEVGRHAEALPYLEVASRVEARPLYAYHLGRCQLALDRPREAVASSRRALALAGEGGASESEREKIHYQLGLALRKLGAREEAGTHLAEAKRIAARWTDTSRAAIAPLAPDAAAPRIAAAPVAPRKEATPLSGLSAEQRLELRRRARAALARSYLNLGVMKAQGERFAEAAQLFEKAAEADAEFPQVQFSLGVARFNAGQFDKATEPLGRALAQRPQDTGIKRMLAMAWLNTKVYDKAAELLADDPDRDRDPSLLYAYGLALLGQGKTAEAAPHLEAAARLRGRKP